MSGMNDSAVSQTDGHLVKDQARREFDGWAKSYDQSIVQRLLFQPAYRMLMEELYRWRRDDPRELDLLDVGSGTGTWIAMVGGSGLPVGKLFGVDYSLSMSAVARQKAEAANADNIAFIRGDAEQLPFPDASS
jgi:ubiquinone/menaquinone biosynthesis C-methylase UbiE